MQKQSNLKSFMATLKPITIFSKNLNEGSNVETSNLDSKKVWRSIMAMTLGVSLGALTGCADNNPESVSSEGNTNKEAKTVAISQIVEHPSLDEIRRGIIEELAAND